MLAIQFSKTEPKPSRRVARPEPSPNHRGVAKTTVLVQEGAAYLPEPLHTVKRKVRKKGRASSRPEEPDYYIRPLRPVKLSGVASAPPFSLRGGRF